MKKSKAIYLVVAQTIPYILGKAATYKATAEVVGMYSNREDAAAESRKCESRMDFMERNRPYDIDYTKFYVVQTERDSFYPLGLTDHLNQILAKQRKDIASET